MEENMITLCMNCHGTKAHADEKYWTDVLLNMNREHYGNFYKQNLIKKGKYSTFAIPN